MVNLKSILLGACIFSISIASAADAPNFWQRIEWQTPDGVTLVGKYHAASDPRALTWVLLHGLGSVKEEWDSFGHGLVQQGNGVFIYDMRGHGESIHGLNGAVLNYQDWHSAGPDSPWSRMPDDFQTAVKTLRSHFKIAEQKIAVGGASVGANISLAYAAKHSRVPAVLLLSPGLEYAGIVSVQNFSALGTKPVMLAASPGDAYAYASVQQLAMRRGDPALRVLEGPQAEHGVNMFKDAAFTKQTLNWAHALTTNK